MFGQVVSDHMAPLHPPSRSPSLVAARALYTAETRPKRAHPRLKGMPRVPVTLRAAQEGLAPARPATMAALSAGYR